MTGMLGGAPGAVQVMTCTEEVFGHYAGSSKVFCKTRARRPVQDSLIEPTSVLDIRSPSPSSTLSSSRAGSSESGLQGSIESGGTVVGLFCEEGYLLDCTSLLECGHDEGTIWQVDGGEDGKAEKAMVGTLQSGDVRASWERNLVHASVEDGEAPKHGEAPHGGFMAGEVVVAAGMSNVGEAPGFTQFFSSTTCSGYGVLDKMMVKSEAMVPDESLDACVMSYRKRDREESSLEEVVLQRFGHGHGHGRKLVRAGDGGLKLEAGQWLPDWTNFYGNAEALVELEKPAAAEKLGQDLDEIFSTSSPLPPSLAGTVLSSAANIGHGNFQSGSKMQLDLYEAVQAGMLGNRRASDAGGSSAGTEADPPLASPAAPPRHRCSSVLLSSSPLHQLGGSPPPFGCAAPPPAFVPNSHHSKPNVLPLSRSATLLNAPYAPPPPTPQFSSHLQQLQELTFPLPSIKHSQQLAQAHDLYRYQKPEYGSSNAEYVDPNPWQIRRLEGDVSAKQVAVPRGPKWPPIKQEPPWQPLGAPHVRTPLLSQPFSAIPATEQPALQRRQPFAATEHEGQRGRLEELSLAERHFAASMEAARLGDFSSAQAILARLNHQQQNLIKGQQQAPSHRVTSLFTDALAKWVSAGSSSPSLVQQTPHEASYLDLIDKISAYKSFCEVSPISQFAHFTANQAILEAMEEEDCVHLIDFELGFGGQWASFMQEISQRSRGPPELKITTIGSSTFEMRLAKENLLQFAKEMGMKLQIDVLPVEKLEGIKAAMVKKGAKEAVAVNFGFGLSRLMADFSCAEGVVGMLEVIKGLNPKVIVVVDSECEFEGTTLLEALQFYECIFNTMEAAGKLSWEVRERIEKMVFGPKIRDVVNARRVVAQGTGSAGLPPWRILMQEAGFSALPFSAAAEGQASWLVKNPLNSGFTFIKQHSTLFLGWCNKTLVSASAWV